MPAEFPVDDISSYLHQAAGLVKRIPSLFDEILRHEKEKKRRDGHHQLIRRLFHHISQDIIDRPSQIKKKKVHCHDRKITNNFFLVVAKKNKTRPTTRGINSWAIRFLLLFEPITISSRKRISQAPLITRLKLGLPLMRKNGYVRCCCLHTKNQGFYKL